MRAGVFAAVVAAAILVSGRASADDVGPPSDAQPMIRYHDEPAKPGFHLVRSQMTGFFLASALVFGASYAVTIGVAASARFQDGSAWLLLPIAGPFIGVSEAKHCGGFAPSPAFVDCASPNGTFGLVALGVLQSLGAALLPFGFLHRRYWQRDLIVPTISVGDGVRFGLSGAF